MTDLTQKRLKEILNYDPATGLFHWRLPACKRMKPGDRAGRIRSDGYVTISINYKGFYAHHLAWFYVHGVLPKYLDHKDRNPSNNQIGNLRVATHAQNCAYSRMHKDSKSQIRGVYKHRKIWVAQLGSNYLGSFISPEEASAAYQAAAKEKYGEFACVS